MGSDLRIYQNNLIASSMGLPITIDFIQIEAKYEIGAGTILIFPQIEIFFLFDLIRGSALGRKGMKNNRNL